MMSKKKFVFTITVVIFLISALSVFSIVKDFTDSGANSAETNSASKPSNLKFDSGCHAQSGTRPPAWNINNQNEEIKLDNKEF